MKRIIILATLSGLVLSCTSIDVPMCRKLKSKTVITKDEFGIPSITVRSNPKCAKAIGEPTCGYCEWTLTDKHQWVGENKKHWLYGKPWSQIDEEATIVPSESMAKVKSELNKNCRDDDGPVGGHCKDAGKWRVKLDSLDSIGIMSGQL